MIIWLLLRALEGLLGLLYIRRYLELGDCIAEGCNNDEQE
jgi:hypothetical protein